MDVVVRHREVDVTVAQPVVDRDDDSTGPLGDLPGDDIGLWGTTQRAPRRGCSR